MQAMYDEYGSHGFTPLAVNLSENMETVVKLYARQVTFPHLRDGGTAWGAYRQNGYIPLNYIVDSSGVIRYIAEGFNETVMRSIILQYLPDPIEHDVGAKRIVSPASSVDSGASVVPACSVYNYGAQAESYEVRMKIGTKYNMTATVTNHQPNTEVYVEFPAWTVLERGQLAVSCSTELATDDVQNNDRVTGLVLAQVYDLAVTAILAPADTVDSAATVTPQVQVKNLGTAADLAKVKVFIGSTYVDSASVPLQPGATATRSFKDWVPDVRGEIAVRCTISGRWEMIPENNLMTKTVWVRTTGIEEPGFQPATEGRFDVQPNPFSGRAVIQCVGLNAERGTARLYTAEGSLVRTVTLMPDDRQGLVAVWDGTDEAGRQVGRGVYYCRVEAGTFHSAEKLVKTQ
jgi:hypothetical protein